MDGCKCFQLSKLIVWMCLRSLEKLCLPQLPNANYGNENKKLPPVQPGGVFIFSWRFKGSECEPLQNPQVGRARSSVSDNHSCITQ